MGRQSRTKPPLKMDPILAIDEPNPRIENERKWGAGGAGMANG